MGCKNWKEKGWFNAAYRTKEMQRAASHRYYLKHQEKLKEIVHKYKTKLWNKLFEIYGNECECCGESNKKFLTVDHVDPIGGDRTKREKKDIVGYLHSLGWPTDNIRILCFNCNCGRERNGGICPHHDITIKEKK